MLLIGRDGVHRWISAETQVALGRYFGPREDKERLPIFPILLGATTPENLPAFLQLFQATHWGGADPLPESLFDSIRQRAIVADTTVKFEGCPFVGLNAYRQDQEYLFFGRQKETLDALACFERRPGAAPVRWLEINGNSGSGKSSMMNAGILPLVDQGWLWPRTGYEHWQQIGPMMPGERPVEMLAEHLARAFSVDMDGVCHRLEGKDQALARMLREKKPDEDTAFILCIDQFEELFTFAEPDERRRFDRLLATAIEDTNCPLFVISTVRADFLDRFDGLPRLANAGNMVGRSWKLPPIGATGLREVIDGPARLAGLDVGEVRAAILTAASNEAGALPLVENALHWLWQRRTGNRLSEQEFTEQGGLTGILSSAADELLGGLDKSERNLAMRLLFHLVKVDPEGRRHTRCRIPLTEALAVAGGGEQGRALVDRLAGARSADASATHGPLRLITVSSGADLGVATQHGNGWVDLIHETLIRSKGLDAGGNPHPYWPTLWNYIEKHKSWAIWRERLQSDVKIWIENGRAHGLRWSSARLNAVLRELERVRTDVVLSHDEQDFLGLIETDEMLAELDRQETSHKRRAQIGERLALLGDLRRGVSLRADGLPDIDWVSVDGDKVTLKISLLPLSLLPLSLLPLSLTVKPFRMARYPVSVEQFRAFIVDCYRDGEWQLPPGFPADVDLLGRPPKLQTYVGNHPVDSVNWYQACAFCHWLAARLNTDIRLPTEFEWQLAATGGDRTRIYPWGPEWNPRREPFHANTPKSDLKGCTAVGMYPAGASPAGILDMAGTVWEWCLNPGGTFREWFLDLFKEPNEVGFSTSRGFRMARGGSWSSDEILARVAVRLRYAPDYRNHLVGFRVVCSSPSSAAEAEAEPPAD